jgi:hypothetical protein
MLPMTDEEDLRLIKPGEIAYHLDLTAAQLKIVHTALTSLRDDLGREEQDVRDVVYAVLDKLPSDHDIRAIDLDRELRGQ